MADLSFDEKAALRALLLELLKLAVKWVATARASGIDLDALIAKAEAENATDIFDMIGRPPAPPPDEPDAYSVIHDGPTPSNAELIALGFEVSDWVGESKDRSVPRWTVVHPRDLFPRGFAYLRDIA